MSDAQPQELGLLAKLVLVLGVVFVVWGIVWHGVSFAVFERMWHDFLARPTAPMAFRFILQPVMAGIAAVLGGIRDARRHRRPFFWRMVREPDQRIRGLRQALVATARVVLLGLVMDCIYQIVFLERFYPSEAVVVAIVLGFLPYVVFRGIATRVAIELGVTADRAREGTPR